MLYWHLIQRTMEYKCNITNVSSCTRTPRHPERILHTFPYLVYEHVYRIISNPQNLCKILGMVVCACNSGTMGGDRSIPIKCWPACLAERASKHFPIQWEALAQINRVDSNRKWQMIWTYMCAYTNTYIYATWIQRGRESTKKKKSKWNKLVTGNK